MNDFTTVLIAAVSGTLIATFGSALRFIPTNIYYFFKRQFTVTTTIRSGYYMYFLIENYIKHSYDIKQFRILKGTDSGKLMMGWSTFIIKFNNKRLLVSSFEDRQAHKSNEDIKGIRYFVITTLGRKHDLIESFIKACDEFSIDDFKGYVRATTYDCGQNTLDTDKVYRRPMESIIMKRSDKEFLLEQIRWFLENEEFYRDNHIPYRLGIMLYGPPGTGKTSLIKALATEFELPINSILGIEHIDGRAIERKTINVIEDIDSYNISKNRETMDQKTIIKDEKFNIGNVLNILDGITSKDDYILIATTNKLDKLDEALIRPGRFDIKIELGYVDNETLLDFLKCHFPNEEVDLQYTIKNDIVASYLQQLILERRSLEYIIKDICDASIIRG